MPKRRRFSAFVKILFALFLVCGVLVAGGYYVLTTVEPLKTEPEPETKCRLDLSDGKYSMELAQAVSATTVGGVAFSLDLPPEAVTVAYATVWQETAFHNLEYGDRDSLGLFQQRPSQEWGEPEEILDPVYASRAFYEALVEVEGWRDKPVFEAAQAVQRSADGYAYDQHENLSQRMNEVFTGTRGPGLTCWYDRETLASLTAGEPDTDGAEQEMTRVFGVDPSESTTVEDPRTGDLGWAMALWAVAHSEEYGLTSVSYEGRTWRASDGTEDGAEWTTSDSDTGGLLVLG
ncbi:hypothetical protein [Nocardiopsis lambiniae]|uniref:Uncharacterized protein n=1 Tax=Nocardiopsis lambiniae TaxID=3075539 RepID=A0ABU2M9F6_9ACTN|nr:hypothetical protein [Nocardiopsis sp. DSM 44743]MDT0329172.1 hypothetical protein [Nocardiopsis sp. DSM 44743]